jgi:metallophosphoesterase (TIGR00282 family)
MRMLHIGDIVGKPGRRIVVQAVPRLKRREQIDFVIANGENAAAGAGITPENYRELIEAQVDCVTLGDHIYRRKAIADILEKEDRIVKPANFPDTSPGRGWSVLSTPQGQRVAVISLLGRVFMRPVDCPWQAVERVLQQIPPEVRVIFVDFHAEATSDKQLMGRHLDGRVTSVLGTHTHVATADEQILPGGTAFQCDIGMTGPHESILGRRIDRVSQTTITFYPTQFDVAEGDVRLTGTLVDWDDSSGRATSIRRLVLTQAEVQSWSAGPT